MRSVFLTGSSGCHRYDSEHSRGRCGNRLKDTVALRRAIGSFDHFTRLAEQRHRSVGMPDAWGSAAQSLTSQRSTRAQGAT
jgi:hypothetical protein